MSPSGAGLYGAEEQGVGLVRLLSGLRREVTGGPGLCLFLLHPLLLPLLLLLLLLPWSRLHTAAALVHGDRLGLGGAPLRGSRAPVRTAAAAAQDLLNLIAIASQLLQQIRGGAAWELGAGGGGQEGGGVGEGGGLGEAGGLGGTLVSLPPTSGRLHVIVLDNLARFVEKRGESVPAESDLLLEPLRSATAPLGAPCVLVAFCRTGPLSWVTASLGPRSRTRPVQTGQIRRGVPRDASVRLRRDADDAVLARRGLHVQVDGGVDVLRPLARARRREREGRGAEGAAERGAERARALRREEAVLRRVEPRHLLGDKRHLLRLGFLRGRRWFFEGLQFRFGLVSPSGVQRGACGGAPSLG